MATRKIILCRGIQGAGKTTWARQWVLEDPEHRVRFNNDDVRNMLGKYWVPNRENFVGRMKSLFIWEAMRYGFNIIIDNMNLNPREVENYKVFLSDWNSREETKYELEFRDFFTPLEVCIERDSRRPNPIGEEVIRKTYEKYKHIIENEK